MSPVAPSSGHASRALLLAIGAVAVGMVVVFGMSVLLTNRHNDRAKDGPTGGVVSLGKVHDLASQIRRGRQPVFFPDASGNSLRPVYVQHTGTVDDRGWSVFLAQVPDAPGSCLWQWSTAARRFDASCDAARHAPADGAGLVQYPVTVRDGRLRVDFRSTTATTSPATTAP